MVKTIKNNCFKRINIFTVILYIYLVIFSTFSYAKSIKLEADNGNIDVSKIDLSKSIIDIYGDIEFYGMQLYEYGEFPIERNFEKIPLSWTEYEAKLSEDAYASYRFTISGLEEGQNYGFLLNAILSAYKLYVDDELIFENGKVGVNRDLFKTDIIPRSMFFQAKNSQIEVTIHVSSFNSHKGGILDKITFGKQELINDKKIKTVFFDSFIFGSIIFMCIYHFMLFFLRRKDRANLYFSLFTLAVAVRTISTNNKLLYYLNYELIELLFIRIDVSSVYFAVPFFLLYFHSLYKDFERSRTFKFLVSFGFALSIITLLSSNKFFLKYTIPPFYFYILIAAGFVVYKIKIYWKQLSSKYLVYGFAIIILGVINDILFDMQKIQSMTLIPLSLLIFLLLQSLFLAKTFTGALNLAEELTKDLLAKNRENEELNKKLLSYNENLEKKIAERVKEIQEKNDELEEKNMKITASISYAKIIQNSTLPNIKDMKKSVGDIFVIWKPRDIVGGDFYWHEERDGAHYIAVGDCTGHGVPGALMSMLSKAALDRIVMHNTDISTTKMLQELNKIMKKSLYKENIDLISDDGLDIGVFKISPDKNKVMYSGAKLNLYYCENGEAKKIKGDRHSIGYRRSKEEFEYNQIEFDSLEDKVFYLTTDGFEDQNQRDSHKMFGRKNLVKMLEEIHHLDFEDQKEIIENKLESFMNGEEQRDDITLIGFKF